MNITGLLFSFKGRIGRGAWWLTHLSVKASTMLVMVTLALVIPSIIGSLKGKDYNSTLLILGGSFLYIFIVSAFVVLLWIELALDIKRLHDRDLSAQYLLLLLIPIVNIVFLLFVCGILPGTEGDNRFGPRMK